MYSYGGLCLTVKGVYSYGKPCSYGVPCIAMEGNV